MKHLKGIKEFNFENIRESIGEELICRWCDKKFIVIDEFQDCCSSDCKSKLSNYQGNDNSMSPWSDDNYSYWD